MFIKVKRRELKNDIAYDFRLSKAYRNLGDRTPKQKTLRTWTIRKSDVGYKSDCENLIDDIKYELDFIDVPGNERRKILTDVRKKLRDLKK